MKTFSEQLLEVQNFDAHYLARQLSQIQYHEMRGRIPAIGRARHSVLDRVLQHTLPTALPEIDDLAFDYAFLSWSTMGTTDPGQQKKTCSFEVESVLGMALGKDVAPIELFTIDVDTKPPEGYVPVSPELTQTAEEEAVYSAKEARYEQHVGFQIFKALRTAILLTPEAKYLGCNDRADPWCWFFETRGETPEYLEVQLNLNGFDLDFELLASLAK